MIATTTTIGTTIAIIFVVSKPLLLEAVLVLGVLLAVCEVVELLAAGIDDDAELLTAVGVVMSVSVSYARLLCGTSVGAVYQRSAY